VAQYRHALRIDPGHYKAWYGLAMIYYRQDKRELAEYHFRRALEIHPNNPALLTRAGSVLIELGKVEEVRLRSPVSVLRGQLSSVSTCWMLNAV
jgi:anaphase-promoting complex subunit 3